MTEKVQLADNPSPGPEGLTRVALVITALRRRILDRTLASGAKVPSIRAMAETLNVSKSTVVDAYERLAAEGVIAARRGAGFYVTGRAAPLSVAEVGPRPPPEVDPLWLTRYAMEAGDHILNPSCGWLPQSWMPEEALRQGMRQSARDNAVDFTRYGQASGHAPLRQLLSTYLAERGIIAPAGQILLTDSGTQAIDLVCRLLLEPGDSVLVDDPCYFKFFGILRASRAKIIGVPLTPNGPDLEKFEAALIEHHPRLYLTNATVQNPTGANLAPQVAHRLLGLAEAHDLTIIEDDIFADFAMEPAPRLAALDGLNRVVYLGSFSKTLSAKLRLGFITARPELMEPLVELRIATQIGGGPASADIVHRVLTNGTYRRHTSALRARLGTAMGTTLHRLQSAGLTPWIEPRAGMFVWARLPDGLRAVEVARQALTEGMVLAPGDAFSLNRASDGFLRFNVAQCSHPAVFSILDKAMSAARQSSCEQS
jgi:DNA-binding transcriptional MocR family regulator